MKRLILACALFLLYMDARAQQYGCTDPQATNYNPSATHNDGSCAYKPAFYSPLKIQAHLSDTILETSGMIYYDDMFWTHNDSDNPPYLYAFDSLGGHILKSVFISNSTNTDWEDLAQDKDFIYIGDFGNNAGTRKDLRILKIKKSDISADERTDTVNAEFIRFEMAEQTDFSDRFINNDFDMEAMFFLRDSLHLLSKNWVDKNTRHYVCPVDTGFYSLHAIETISVEGQISGADVQSDGTVALIGYTKPLYPCYLWLFWDYTDCRFNSGNRRKIDLGHTLYPGQIESVTFHNKSIYLTNENKVASQQLLRLDYERWTDTSTFNSTDDTFYERTKIHFAEKTLKIWSLDLQDGMKINIYDNTGKNLDTIILRKIDSETFEPIHLELPDGIYFVRCQKIVLGKIISY